jgi:hypothetical protein
MLGYAVIPGDGRAREGEAPPAAPPNLSLGDPRLDEASFGFLIDFTSYWSVFGPKALKEHKANKTAAGRAAADPPRPHPHHRAEALDDLPVFT